MFISMYKILVISIVLYLTHRVKSTDPIYRLNETEYRKMPVLYAMDYYQDCMLEPGGTYCIVDFELFTEGRSSLMEMIHGYSKVTTKHYNHTQIHRGICVTQTCKSFIGTRDLNNKTDVSTILASCANDTIWNKYNIESRVFKLKSCKREGDAVTYDASDYVCAVVLIILIGLNAVGTYYGITKNKDGKGNPYLMAFSTLNNYKKLVAPSGEGIEPRLQRLKLFNGLRTMTIMCVIFSHTSLVLTFSYVKNPLYVEMSLEDPSKQILFNGTVVVYTFLVMSAFLLSFNFELYAEKHRIGWMELPKGLLMRWLRLTPSYVLVLGIIATVMRRLGSGPLWDDIVTSESKACRQYWWSHILYINNYIYSDWECLPQTWYLAADTQLFAAGLVFCIAVRTPRARKVTLSLMMLVSLIIPALHTYFQDLEAVVIQSPENTRSLYQNDDSFRRVYIAGHTNLASYILGLAGGLLAYHWLTTKKPLEQFKKYRYLLWATVPVDILVILSGALFYGDERATLALRVAYSALHKPFFQFVVVFLIVACIFKTENLYRGIVEWRGFSWTGRISYSAFLVHSLVLRGLAASIASPLYLTDYYMMMIYTGAIFLSFLMASILWICVEAPVKELTKAALTPRQREENTKI